ncbi:hypothetical protein ABZ345_21745 [Lentzea sp. NPDC005914]|uniref:hypothetical protein n=1 Tax=Lentzea sp. NPDC005914 TaxID=3154572 RepID=UPI0034010922
MNGLRKALACAAAGLSLAGVFTASAQAAPEVKVGVGHWSRNCDYGHACIYPDQPSPGLWWVFDACGFHDFGLLPWSGKAHGNPFRVTYQDGRWDDVEAWTSRRLDARNQAKYVYVYC